MNKAVHKTVDMFDKTASPKSGIAPLPVRALRAIPGRGLPDLPQFYYHTNFCDMLDFVAQRYAPIMTSDMVAFGDNFLNLPRAAQCAYVRLVGRKGYIFNTRKLSYPEISRLDDQWEILRDAGFITSIEDSDFETYLSVITKPELTILLQDICPSLYKKSWKKADLVGVASKHLDFDTLSLPRHVVKQKYRKALRFWLFLFFGKIEDSLQPFTLRDLGLVSAPDYKNDYAARFDTAKQAQAAYFYAGALADFKSGNDESVAALIDTCTEWPAPQCDISLAAKDKLTQKLGGLSERLGDVQTALSLYTLSDAPLCNERVIRLRYSRNQDFEDGPDRDWVKTRLEALIDNPGSDDEHSFASDFYARKYRKKRTSAVTDILRNADTLALDEAYRNAPERAAQRHYDSLGFTTYRTENRLWKTLFGLMFWEELYGDAASRLHNSFERLPAGLTSGTFYDDYKDAIELKLSRFTDPSSVHIEILKTVTRHHRTPNGVFRWSARSLDAVKALLKASPGEPIANMLRIMAQGYSLAKDGFPDLMRVGDTGLEFIEIKAEGDVLRRNQLTRLKQLRSAGFVAKVARVTWRVDPSQIYVIVDVETTGGRASRSRVTEIGAVKMRGEEIIGEFSTLLNPGCLIPSNITRLTGITNEMVASAPVFADVADDFAAFMGDSIFAAHNVNFDYSFISEEYKRIGRSFRFPKICTCASMRKLYPGYRSYSLKNLCSNFDIDLTSHHRALCDAKAAAQLLLLVNKKRVEIEAED